MEEGESPLEAQLAAAILSLLADRRPDATICPSDAARAVDPENFRPLMEPTRQVAAGLAAEGRIQITQKGEVVDLTTVRGPIRLRLPRR